MFEFRAIDNADVVENILWDTYANHLKAQA